LEEEDGIGGPGSNLSRLSLALLEALPARGWACTSPRAHGKDGGRVSEGMAPARGPTAHYVSNKLLRGAHVRRRPVTRELPVTGGARPGGQPDAPVPRICWLPARRVAAHCCRRPEAERPHGARARGHGSCALFPAARVSHRPPRSQCRANTGAQTAEKFPTGAATKAAAASSSSASSSSSAAAAAAPVPPRPVPPAPPPAANLVRGSRCRAPIGQRNAPRHNGAARRRRARQRRGFPLSPQSPAAGKVRAGAGLYPGTPSGRTLGPARRRAGVARVGRSLTPGARWRSRATQLAAEEDGVRGTQQVGLAAQVRLPAYASPVSGTRAAGRWRGGFAAPGPTGQREQHSREDLSWMLGSPRAIGVGGRSRLYPAARHRT
jgi:hypothetical protein